MSVLKKVIIFIKNIFTKRDEVKKLAEPVEDRKKIFTDSLKINIIDNKKKCKIETLVCDGDGLGIQKKITS